MITLEAPIEKAVSVEPKRLSKLNNIGIVTAGDFLRHFPFRYEDYADILPIADLSAGQTATVSGKITAIRSVRTWKKKMVVTEALIQDGSGTIRATWFNLKHVATSLPKGALARLSGKVSSDKKGLFLSSPEFERSGRIPTHTGRLVPVYPETEGLTSRWIRWKMQELLKKEIRLEDPLPEDILSRLHLPPLGSALRSIHFPESKTKMVLAQKRFAFEEMFLLQIQSFQIKNLREKSSAPAIAFDKKTVREFVNSLPFKLTDAQRKAAWQILRDLEKPLPMNRLLNGDVGSGKTIVAAVAALQTVSEGFQVAVMAPTEVLARQHFMTFSNLLQNYDINIALLTNSYKEINNLQFSISNFQSNPDVKNSKLSRDKMKSVSRNKLTDEIRNGTINLLIGTHALIQKDVSFKNLALVVIDEQHRFGVAQRASLQKNISRINDGLPGKIPHLLSMTATPIPRTLALAFFGNLDLSVLDEMPKNRKSIITKIIPPKERPNVYDFIRNEATRGRQTFVILPLVEESKALADVKAAVAEHERLSKDILPDLSVGLLHGRLKSKEKETVMRDFKDGKYDILVSTAVVEVGIDVPNATVMLIEDADRFGLSQLHQFRGRVGRGEHQSYCFLFAGSSSNSRLKALEKHTDGFALAEKDLKLRGPGEFLGTRQSGLPDIAMENLANVKLIEIAREEARKILFGDPSLSKHPLLKQRLDSLNQDIHME